MFSWISKRLRNQRSSCQPSFDHGESKGIPEKHLLLLHGLCKAIDCVDYNKLWKILQEMGVTELTCLLSNMYAGQEATVRMGHGTWDMGHGTWDMGHGTWDMEQQTSSKLGKEYDKVIYCHPACLTSMQCTS